MGVWYQKRQGLSQAWHFLKFEYKNQHEFYKFLGLQQQCAAFDLFNQYYLYGNGHIWQCYDFIFPTCDPWQQHFLSVPFYAHPIIRFYTINYIPLLFLSFSPFAPCCLIHEVGWYSDRPTLWCALHHLLPSQSPIFMSQTHQKGCGTYRFFFFITHTLCNCWRCVPGWEINLAMMYISLHFFHPRLHYEHDWHRQKNWDKKKQGCVIFFVCAVLFRWCASFTRIVGSGPLCFLFTTVT